MLVEHNPVLPLPWFLLFVGIFVGGGIVWAAIDQWRSGRSAEKNNKPGQP